MEDHVLINIVHQSVPSWAWGGINRCRIYLHANTVVDLTTEDGTYIPSKIREVKDRKTEIENNSMDLLIIN